MDGAQHLCKSGLCCSAGRRRKGPAQLSWLGPQHFSVPWWELEKNLPLAANGNCWNLFVPPAVAGEHTPLGWKVLASPSPSSVGARGERSWEEAARLWGPGKDQGALPEAELGRETSAHPSPPWLDPASTLVLWAVLLQGPAK